MVRHSDRNMLHTIPAKNGTQLGGHAPPQGREHWPPPLNVCGWEIPGRVSRLAAWLGHHTTNCPPWLEGPQDVLSICLAIRLDTETHRNLKRFHRAFVFVTEFVSLSSVKGGRARRQMNIWYILRSTHVPHLLWKFSDQHFEEAIICGSPM